MILSVKGRLNENFIMCICLLLKQTIASMPVLLTPGLACCEERKKSKVIIVVVICILQFFNRVNVGRLVCRNTIVTYQGEICWLAWPDYYLCSFFFQSFSFFAQRYQLTWNDEDLPSDIKVGSPLFYNLDHRPKSFSS